MTSQRPGQRAYPYGRRLAPAEVDQAADDYLASLDRRQYVGKRHHIVPRFILARFANNREQVWVRDRVTDTATDTGGLRNVKDLAIRDFYTFIDKSGELDSSFESLIGEVETTADKVLKAHIDSPFYQPRPFDSHDRNAVDALVSMQAVRGHSHRRVGEILTDYTLKLLNRDQLTEEELTETEFVPHQNDLLLTSMGLASHVHENLATRACFLITIDRPLLITCDEPVFTEPDATPEMIRRPSSTDGNGDGEYREGAGYHPSPGGKGLAAAITMPISPRHAVMYDRPGTVQSVARHHQIGGHDADEFAAATVSYAISNAYSWLAGHPDNPTFKTMTLPVSPPPLTITDGDTPMSRRIRETPRRTARRLDKAARPIALETPD